MGAKVWTALFCGAVVACGSSEEGVNNPGNGSDAGDGSGGVGTGGTAGNGATGSGGVGTGGSGGVGTGGSGATGSGGIGTGGTGAGGSGGSPDGSLHFAVIGDFGSAADVFGIFRANEEAVANLVKSKNVDFVITTGDNNYPDGAASTIDTNIGQFYAEFIGNYTGAFGPGSATNRFWPSVGNHDWRAPNLQPHIDYFTLPGNERYYDVDLGLVHLFAVDSEGGEPDGTTADSVQGQWLQQALGASTSCFDIVYFHRPAYSSGDHGSSMGMRWPFEEWGADVVMAGHDHSYERLQVGGIPYFVNGLGGALTYPWGTLLEESQVRYNASYGAMFVTVSSTGMQLEFVNIAGEVIDTHTIPKSCP